MNGLLHRFYVVKWIVIMYVSVYKATVAVVDIDSGAEEKIIAISQGSATGLNLKENQKIYFGGLPTIGNYRYIQNTFMIHKTVVFIVKKVIICDTYLI